MSLVSSAGLEWTSPERLLLLLAELDQFGEEFVDVDLLVRVLVDVIVRPPGAPLDIGVAITRGERDVGPAVVPHWVVEVQPMGLQPVGRCIRAAARPSGPVSAVGTLVTKAIKGGSATIAVDGSFGQTSGFSPIEQDLAVVCPQHVPHAALDKPDI